MAWWIVRRELEHLDLDAYRTASREIALALRAEIGDLYETRCETCAGTASTKYFLWVKQQVCPACARAFDLWPGMLVSKNARHPAYVVACAGCGRLNEREAIDGLGDCSDCQEPLTLAGNARRGKATCRHCGETSAYPSGASPLDHRLFAMEYHCPRCRPSHAERFFKSPDARDLANVQAARERLQGMRARFIPNDRIPRGDETNRLHRWGYRRYRELFNDRQLLGLELLARAISKVADARVRGALATNLSDLLRYQNLCCRYDTMALKSLDVFSVHGFPVSLVQCESNLLGVTSETGANIGSGGWTNITAKYDRAKHYCDFPFETVGEGPRKRTIPTPDEWIGDLRDGVAERSIDVRCGDSARVEIAADSLDAVFTDPPYFGNVQYAELMDFCYVWLRKLVGGDEPGFAEASTRNVAELTGNATEGRGIEHFTSGLSQVFCAMGKALKSNAPLAFTYHHNRLDAYAPLVVAILDSGLPCTAVLPCPGEMGGSIHISGTGSSTVDSVFTCRKGAIPAPAPNHPADELTARLAADVRNLAQAGHEATSGDLRCLLHGHAARLAIVALWSDWAPTLPVEDRLKRAGAMLETLVDLTAVKSAVAGQLAEDWRAEFLFDPTGATS
jgi:hypothetical protein